MMEGESKKPSKTALTSNSSSSSAAAVSRLKICDTLTTTTMIKVSPKTRRRKSQKLCCYRLSDVVVSLLIIFPLVIAFWRGVWNLMEYYSKLYDIDPWLSIVVGYAIPFFLYWCQEPLKKHVRPGKMNFVLFYLISRYLLLLHSFGSVNQWRGLWALLDYQLGTGFYSALGSLLVGVILSVILKTFCNVLAPPLYLAVDDAYAIHDCPLRFHTPPKFTFSYLADAIFSVFVAASLVVSCWRGLWELSDLYLYPDDVIYSAIASLSIGYLICLFLFTLQPHIYQWMTKLRGNYSRLIVADTVTFVGFVGCVLAWRGLWMMYDEFLGTPNASDWATTIVGALGSLVLGCISTIIVRGVAVDGELAVDGTAEWPIPYLSLLRDTIYDVPFPEPCLFRCLCTKQTMNCGDGRKGAASKKKMKKTNNSDVHHVIDLDGGDGVRNLKTNSIHTDQPQQYSSKVAAAAGASPPYHHIELRDLSNLRNIDSSSEEDLGSRRMMKVRHSMYEDDDDDESADEERPMNRSRQAYNKNDDDGDNNEKVKRGEDVINDNVQL